MNKIKNFFLIIVLAVAACRSVPSDVSEAHKFSMVESKAAFEIADTTLTAVANKSAELNDERVTALHTKWLEHKSNISKARAVVRKYLVETDAGADLTGAYDVATVMLNDMDNGFASVNRAWEEMIDPANSVQAETFISLFRRDIERYKELEKKFDDWISQFRVKG